jgi:polysaccharide chain length determinant protein (PEP-CTERM system associated)
MTRSREQTEHGFDFVLDVWQRRKWIALVVFSAVFSGIASLALSLPDIYRATTTVMVERQQVSEAFVRPTVTSELETRIQTIHKQVMSRERLSEVITRLDLYPELKGHAPIDAIVERMRRDVDFSLTGVDQSSGRAATIAFTLSYTGRDPVTVAEVANTLTRYHVEENTKSRERQAVRTTEFLRAQLSDIKRALDSQQQRVGQFKQQHNGELAEQVETNLAALDRFNNQLRLNGEYQIRAMERRERLEHDLATAATAAKAPPAPAADTPASQLAKLKDQLIELRRKYSDQYPDVVHLRQEIASFEQVVHAAGESQPAPAAENSTPTEAPAAKAGDQALREVESQLQTLKAEEVMLRQVISGYESRVENAPKRQEEFQQLTRDSDSSKEQYETLLKRYEEAQLTENLEQGQNVEQFRVLDSAIPSARPAAPNRMWLVGMGLFGALALALGAVVGAEKLDTTFHSVEDLRAFARIPAVAVIRRIPTPSEARHRRIRRTLVAASVAAALALIVVGARHLGTGNEQIVMMTTRGRG